MITFEVGKTYYARHICDHNSIEKFTVVKRTDRTITVEIRGKTMVRRTTVYTSQGTSDKDVEIFYPHGKYSMAMCVYASSDKEIKPDWEK